MDNYHLHFDMGHTEIVLGSTCYLDEREDGLIECMHCGQEIETDMEAQDYDEHV